MKNLQKNFKIISALLLLNLITTVGFCQNNDKVSIFNVNAVYQLPSNRNGLTESAFKLNVKVAISGTDIIIGISHKQGTALNPDPSFKYGYTYQGKQYGDGTLGKGVFEGIRADLLRYKVIVHCGAQIWERVIDGVAMVDRFGPVDKNTKASEVYVVVEVASLDYGGGTGTDLIEKKIQEILGAEDKKKRYDDLIIKANSSFSSNNWSDASAAYQQASNILPNENYPKEQLEKIKINQANAKEQDERNKIEVQKKAEADKKAEAERQTQTQTANSSTSNSSQGGNNTQNNNSSGESANSNSNQNSNNQSGEITNMSDYVGTGDRYNSIKVYQQNGKYYVQNQDGSLYETTKQDFDRIHALSASNKQIEINNAKLRNDPLANYNDQNKSDFEQGYERGQQISDAITPLGNALVDAWNRKVDRENAHALSTRSVDDRRRDDYSILQTDLNAKLNDNSYFTQTVIQKIPSLLNTNSPTWESLLNSKELALTFGKDYLYTTENFTQITGTTLGIKKEIRLDILDTKNYYRKNYVLPRFNAFTASYRYKYTYILNGVSYPWKAGFQGQGIQHEFDFIYNENNIVIGIKLKILTGYYTYTPSFPIEEYYKDIFSKVGLNYLLLDANTILLKDKLIIINYESIEMYDLNVLSDQYLVNWGNYSTSPNFKKLGVGFKKLSEKSVKENYSDEYLKYVFYSTSDKGVIIGSLVKDGLGEKAGLKVDDIISNINGIPVTSPYMLQLVVQAPTIDNKLQITYLRNGIEYKATVNI